MKKIVLFIIYLFCIFSHEDIYASSNEKNRFQFEMVGFSFELPVDWIVEPQESIQQRLSEFQIASGIKQNKYIKQFNAYKQENSVQVAHFYAQQLYIKGVSQEYFLTMKAQEKKIFLKKIDQELKEKINFMTEIKFKDPATSPKVEWLDTVEEDFHNGIHAIISLYKLIFPNNYVENYVNIVFFQTDITNTITISYKSNDADLLNTVKAIVKSINLTQEEIYEKKTIFDGVLEKGLQGFLLVIYIGVALVGLYLLFVFIKKISTFFLSIKSKISLIKTKIQRTGIVLTVIILICKSLEYYDFFYLDKEEIFFYMIVPLFVSLCMILGIVDYIIQWIRRGNK